MVGAGLWWAMTGSNCRPPRCKRGALPTELIARVGTMAPDAAGPGADVAAAPDALVDGVLKALAGLELGLVGGRNLDLLAGPRIAAFRGGALRHDEGAEIHQAHFLARLQGAGDAFEDAVNRAGTVGLGETGAIGHRRDEIVVVHLYSPPL